MRPDVEVQGGGGAQGGQGEAREPVQAGTGGEGGGWRSGWSEIPLSITATLMPAPVRPYEFQRTEALTAAAVLSSIPPSGRFGEIWVTSDSLASASKAPAGTVYTAPFIESKAYSQRSAPVAHHLMVRLRWESV